MSRCSSAKVFGGSALRGVHGCQTLGRPAQGWFEGANAQPGQGGLYTVHNARAFPHQAVALAVRPLGVLFGNRGHARHAAMAPFSTQPPQEPALQQLGVELVGFRLAMLPRYRSTRGMDHVRLDATRLKPAPQPEAVAAGFEGNRNPRDRVAGPDRLILPAMQQGQQPFWVRLQLLARIPGTTPPTSQLDWLSSTTAMIVLSWSRATRDLLKSFGWGIAALHRFDVSDEIAILAARPIASLRWRGMD